MVPFDLPEFLNSHMLWSALAILAVAVARLASPAEPAAIPLPSA